MKRKVINLTLEEIREINKKYGGGAFMESNMDTAIAQGEGRGLYIQIAYLVRALVVGHSYSDANKRTAFIITRVMLLKNGIKLNTEQKDELAKQIAKMTKKEIDNVGTIARMIEYAVKGY